MLERFWRLPRAPFLTRALTAHSLGLAASLTAAAFLTVWIETTRLYPIKTMAVFLAFSSVAAGFLHLHPFDRFGAANYLTMTRMVLVALAAALVGESPTSPVAWTASLLGVGSTALDGVDGWLARRSGMTSAFGARYDMEVDALLIMVLAILAWRHDKAGAWILLAGALRYLFVGAGYLWGWLDAPLPASTRRKAVCVVQIVGLVLVVAPFVPPTLSVPIAAVTLASLVWSFGVDVFWLRRHRV